MIAVPTSSLPVREFRGSGLYLSGEEAPCMRVYSSSSSSDSSLAESRMAASRVKCLARLRGLTSPLLAFGGAGPPASREPRGAVCVSQCFFFFVYFLRSGRKASRRFCCRFWALDGARRTGWLFWPLRCCCCCCCCRCCCRRRLGTRCYYFSGWSAADVALVRDCFCSRPRPLWSCAAQHLDRAVFARDKSERSGEGQAVLFLGRGPRGGHFRREVLYRGLLPFRLPRCLATR